MKYRRRQQKKTKKSTTGRKRSQTFATKQMATIQETVEFDDLKVNTISNMSFSLSQFDRASALAPSFKWYKATKVEWKLNPQFNLYSDGVALESVPYMYTRMNRTQDSLFISKDDLQSMGAKPVKFTSPRTLKYVPNWCSGGLTTFSKDPATGYVIGGTSQGLKPQYSYLACPGVDPPGSGVAQFTPIDGRDAPVIPLNSGMYDVATNAVRYNGNDIFFDQLYAQGSSVVAKVTCTVTWSFRDPNFNNFIADPAPKLTILGAKPKAKPETIDPIV